MARQLYGVVCHTFYADVRVGPGRNLYGDILPTGEWNLCWDGKRGDDRRSDDAAYVSSEPAAGWDVDEPGERSNFTYIQQCCAHWQYSRARVSLFQLRRY